MGAVSVGSAIHRRARVELFPTREVSGTRWDDCSVTTRARLLGVDDLLAFYDARRERLIARIKDKLRTQVGATPAVESSTSGEIDAALGEGDLDD